MKQLVFIILFFLIFFAHASAIKVIDSLELKVRVNKAEDINLDTFITYWIYNTTKDIKQPRLKEAYKDSVFYYFTRKQKTYKIRREELDKVNYKEIKTDSVRRQFFRAIIPSSDKKKAENCDWKSVDPQFTCKYSSFDTFIVYCHYKKACYHILILNKKYSATYSIKNGAFINLKTD